jgi:hypothetical protein
MCALSARRADSLEPGFWMARCCHQHDAGSAVARPAPGARRHRGASASLRCSLMGISMRRGFARQPLDGHRSQACADTDAALAIAPQFPWRRPSFTARSEYRLHRPLLGRQAASISVDHAGRGISAIRRPVAILYSQRTARLYGSGVPRRAGPVTNRRGDGVAIPAALALCSLGCSREKSRRFKGM